MNENKLGEALLMISNKNRCNSKEEELGKLSKTLVTEAEKGLYSVIISEFDEKYPLLCGSGYIGIWCEANNIELRQLDRGKYRFSWNKV